MAWTKTKIAIVTAAAALLAAGTAVVTVKAAHSHAVARADAAHPIPGAWEGVMQVRGETLHLVYKISHDNGRYQTTMDSIEQNATNLPVAGFVYDYPRVRLEARTIEFIFNGKMSADASEIFGSWRQGGLSGDMTLVKTNNPDTVAEALDQTDYAPRGGSDLQGLWEGTLKVGNVTLRLNLKIAQQPDGTFRAALDSVDQGVSDIPASSFSYNKPSVTIGFSGTGGTFQGNLGNNNTKITGKWTQNGQSYPLTFTQANLAVENLKTMDENYVYTSPQDLQGHWKGALNIQGTTLHLIINIAEKSDDTFSSTLQSIDQGGVEIPANDITYDAPNVIIDWKGIGGTFKGTLSDGKLSGTWTQGRAALLLKLER